MKLQEFVDNIIITEWIDTLNPSQATRKLYLQSMKTFCEWTKMTPEQLLNEAEEEIKSGKLMRQRKIKSYLVGFRKDLQDQGLAQLTVRARLTGVKSFYKSFDVEIPSLPRLGNRARPKEENKDIPTREDLQEVLKVCDPLEKAVLLVGLSSGLSSNEIQNLTVNDFKKGYDPETQVTILDLRRGKVGYDFVTFLTPEASQAIWDYLSYRDRKPKVHSQKRVMQLNKQKVVENSYLFIVRNVPYSYLQTGDENVRKLDNHNVVKIYRSISEKSQKNTKTGTWNLIRSHNSRKYFNSAMLNAGADSFFVEFLMGHTLDDTRSAYFRASPDKLKEIYLKFVPYLTIQKELNISESPEYLRIKQENQILQAETARHVVERSELQELRVEMEKMKEASASAGSIKEGYMQFADMNEIIEMKNTLKQELEEISKLKETLLKNK